jgi:hypothetical protein
MTPKSTLSSFMNAERVRKAAWMLLTHVILLECIVIASLLSRTRRDAPQETFPFSAFATRIIARNCASPIVPTLHLERISFSVLSMCPLNFFKQINYSCTTSAELLIDIDIHFVCNNKLYSCIRIISLYIFYTSFRYLNQPKMDR